jgi:uncharacterized protein
MRPIVVLFALLLTALPVSANAGFAEGMQAYKNGAYTDAFNEWLLLALKGHPKAQNNLGILYRRGLGVPKDPAKAIEWYRKAAEQDFAKAQYNLGLMYKQGEGVGKDLTQAINWYTQAAANGYARARFALGLRFEQGNGVERNPVVALKWLNLGLDEASGKLEKSITRARDRVMKTMSNKEIAEAERLIRKFEEEG